MADMYARVFYNRLLVKDDDDRFLCNCTISGTFGKYCEYQLTHGATSFSQAIEAQFRQKADDSWNTQRYGSILCYGTLPCSSNNFCLDWRDICDGIQHCAGGIDEENWDKLEFNECEEDEFRCTNGMCIPEEFWLDGNCDCMDWSDELDCLRNRGSCSLGPYAMECDERICERNEYFCGDGECIDWFTRIAFERSMTVGKDCFNKRNLNYMCELSRFRRAWTLESGLCWPDENYNDIRYPSWNMIHLSNLSNNEICDYLFRCVLTDGLERDCPCNYQNCTKMMLSVCPLSDYYVLYPPQGLINPYYSFYFDYSQSTKNPNAVIWTISGSIRCRGYLFRVDVGLTSWFRFGWFPTANTYHALCSDEHSNRGERDFSSSLQYDEHCWNDSLTFNGRLYAVNPDLCASRGQCISQYRIYDGHEDCVVPSDERLILENSYCTENVGSYRFQCFNDEHACLPLSQLGSGVSECSNNYDETWYDARRELCRTRYTQSPFSEICSISFEFGCYLSHVLDPLDIQSNRPCINLTQIGDGAEDCYNAYDEKNILKSLATEDMFGFDLICGNKTISYNLACAKFLKANCN
ncbi:unnamed protein product, partial [Rotaria sp. Silwood1]